LLPFRVEEGSEKKPSSIKSNFSVYLFQFDPHKQNVYKSICSPLDCSQPPWDPAQSFREEPRSNPKFNVQSIPFWTSVIKNLFCKISCQLM